MDTSPQALVEPTYPKAKRRMRSNAEKRRIVEETFEGTSVAAVARRHGMNANLLVGWRRRYEQGLLDQCREPASAKLVPVRITSDDTVAEPAQQTPILSEIEVTLPGDVRVRVFGSVDTQALADVLSVLR
jgi:transposase